MTAETRREVVLIAIVVGQAADAVFTLAAIKGHKGIELNPIMAHLLGAPYELVALKILLGVVIALTLLIRWDSLKRLAWPFSILIAAIGFFSAATGLSGLV